MSRDLEADRSLADDANAEMRVRSDIQTHGTAVFARRDRDGHLDPPARDHEVHRVGSRRRRIRGQRVAVIDRLAIDEDDDSLAPESVPQGKVERTPYVETVVVSGARLQPGHHQGA